MRTRHAPFYITAIAVSSATIALAQQADEAQPPVLQQQQQQQQQPALQEQQPGQPAQASPEAGAEQTLARFIGNDTVALARVDLSQVNLQAADQWINDILQASTLTDAQQQQAAAQLGQQVTQLTNWIDQLQKAGAEQAYLVYDQHDGAQAQAQQQPQQAMPMGAVAPAVIVPVGPNDDAQAIQRLLEPQGNEAMIPGAPQAQVIDGAVVLAAPESLQRLQNNPPAGEAKLLTQALETIHDASVQIAIKPTQHTEQMLESLAAAMKQNQGQQQQNGQEQEQQQDLKLTQNVRWIAAGIGLQEQGQAAHVTIQAESPEAAQQLQQQINHGLELLSQQQQQFQQQQQPGAADQATGQQPGQANGEAQLAGSIQVLQPAVEGDQLTVTLSNEQARQLFRQNLAPALGRMLSALPHQAQQQQQPQQQPEMQQQGQQQEQQQQPLTPPSGQP